jgi:manganese transport protein
MATDVAEFIGAALGLNLLFGVPMPPAGLITGLITFAVLGLRARGRRHFELAIVALLGLVTAGFLYEALRLGPSVPASLHGLVNMAMLAVAARAFHSPVRSKLDTIGQAHAELARLAGGGAALVFAVALLASGVCSSSVGTCAGEVIMAGFVRLRVPLLGQQFR